VKSVYDHAKLPWASSSDESESQGSEAERNANSAQKVISTPPSTGKKLTVQKFGLFSSSFRKMPPQYENNSAGEALDDLLGSRDLEMEDDGFESLGEDGETWSTSTGVLRAPVARMTGYEAAEKSGAADADHREGGDELPDVRELAAKSKTKKQQVHGKASRREAALAELFRGSRVPGGFRAPVDTNRKRTRSDHSTKAGKMLRKRGGTGDDNGSGGRKRRLRLRNWKGEAIAEDATIVEVWEDEVKDVDGFQRFLD
jgi:hypothetical protein